MDADKHIYLPTEFVWAACVYMLGSLIELMGMQLITRSGSDGNGDGVQRKSDSRMSFTHFHLYILYANHEQWYVFLCVRECVCLFALLTTSIMTMQTTMR